MSKNITLDEQAKPFFNKKYWLCWVGLLMLLVSSILGMTPLHWILIGRPSETYPEFVWLTYGVPISAFVIFLGLATGSKFKKEYWLFWIGGFLMFVSMLLPLSLEFITLIKYTPVINLVQFASGWAIFLGLIFGYRATKKANER